MLFLSHQSIMTYVNGMFCTLRLMWNILSKSHGPGYCEIIVISGWTFLWIVSFFFFFLLICENENSGLRRFSVSENITSLSNFVFVEDANWWRATHENHENWTTPNSNDSTVYITPMMLLQVFKILIKMCTTYTIRNSIPQTLLFKAEPSINRHFLPYFA